MRQTEHRCLDPGEDHRKQYDDGKDGKSQRPNPDPKTAVRRVMHRAMCLIEWNHDECITILSNYDMTCRLGIKITFA